MGRSRSRSAIAHYERLLDFVNPDFSAHTWNEATQLVIDGQAGYTVMADWADAAFAKQDSATEWNTPASRLLVHRARSTSSPIPLRSPSAHRHRRQAATDWLTTISSVQGQKLFNQTRGSIPARIDIVASEYGAYQQTAIESFANDEIVSSLAHGAAARVT